MINLWQAASLPFWFLAVYFLADAVVTFLSKKVPGKPRSIPLALLLAGIFAYCAARVSGA